MLRKPRANIGSGEKVTEEGLCTSRYDFARKCWTALDPPMPRHCFGEDVVVRVAEQRKRKAVDKNGFS